jgi:hypothetical protein
MVNARLKVPPSLTVGVPMALPLKLTSTVSPALKPDPFAVMDAPARPEFVDSFNAGAATAVGLEVGSGVVVAAGPGLAWLNAVDGNIKSAAVKSTAATIAPLPKMAARFCRGDERWGLGLN